MYCYLRNGARVYFNASWILILFSAVKAYEFRQLNLSVKTLIVVWNFSKFTSLEKISLPLDLPVLLVII
ncbi:hypothetical protein MLD38_004139 [Melastoma candidum]|uniref:Uncharacterized protein n=1 Tax=Melastoma candidum TaxID=119954 RepID=A0ACB9S525_9MYRT|nr:hypothetical protein MLD38_004139 [Melastoma candidum]